MIRKYILLFFVLSLAGCASPATTKGMIVNDYISPKQVGDKIFVKNSIGGSDTSLLGPSQIPNDNFTAAIKESLINSKVFSALADYWGDDWGLEVNILSVKQPMIGASFTVQIDIKYVLYFKGKKVYETYTSESGTAKWNESFLGVTRLRLANEYSAKANIKKFIQELASRKLNEIEYFTDNTIAINKSQNKFLNSKVDLPLPPSKLTHLAVVNLTTLALTENEVRSLTEKLRTTLINTRFYRIVSQADMDVIIKQQELQYAGACDETQCLVQIGKLLAVEYVVGGTVGRVGSTYNITIRMVNVETGEIEISVEKQYKGESDILLNLVEHLGKLITQRFSEVNKKSDKRQK